jgi:hypothetical protein
MAARAEQNARIVGQHVAVDYRAEVPVNTEAIACCGAAYGSPLKTTTLSAPAFVPRTGPDVV